MTLKSIINSDALHVFCNVSEFAETVTYHPFKYTADDTRTDRTINIVVIRNQMRQDDDVSAAVTPVFEIYVHNNAVTGISSDELDLGNDQISFPIREGEASSRRTIVQLFDHDHGMLTLECR